MTRSLNVVTICASGNKALRTTRNPARLKLLEVCVTAIAESSWQNIHAIVLPGGHFFHGRYLGNLAYADRKAAIESSVVGELMREGVQQLHTLHAGITLICGIDNQSPNKWERGDEFCVAWNHTGVIGIGRKIFPVNGDTNGKFGKCIAIYGQDFTAPERFITLATGHKAVLCACYDMFGLNEWPGVASPRKSYLRYLYHQGELVTKSNRSLSALRHDYVGQWRSLLEQEKPNVAISAIHHFAWPNADCFWQRHGIATASAAMQGGLAIAAAHFEDYLPYQQESPLAAYGVSAEHLSQGCYRKALPYPASDALPVVRSGSESAMIRYYSLTQ